MCFWAKNFDKHDNIELNWHREVKDKLRYKRNYLRIVSKIVLEKISHKQSPNCVSANKADTKSIILTRARVAERGGGLKRKCEIHTPVPKNWNESPHCDVESADILCKNNVFFRNLRIFHQNGLFWLSKN